MMSWKGKYQLFIDALHGVVCEKISGNTRVAHIPLEDGWTVHITSLPGFKTFTAVIEDPKKAKHPIARVLLYKQEGAVFLRAAVEYRMKLYLG